MLIVGLVTMNETGNRVPGNSIQRILPPIEIILK